MPDSVSTPGIVARRLLWPARSTRATPGGAVRSRMKTSSEAKLHPADCATAGSTAQWLGPLDELEHIAFQVIEERQLALAGSTGWAAGERDAFGTQRITDGVKVVDRECQVTPPGIVAPPVGARLLGSGDDLHQGLAFRRADEPSALGP